MNASPDPILRIPETVQRDILDYRAQVRKFIAGETSPVAFRAYRVPMGIYEQRTAGHFMVRVRVGAGMILPHQMQRLAQLSQKHGNGVLHMTTRQDIQIHDVPIEHTPDVLEGLLEVGLTSRGGGGNTVRNISACPRCGSCPREQFDVGPWAIAAAEYLLQFKSSYNLPRKFKVAFSGCPRDCASASATDLGFFAHLQDGQKGFAVYAGGGLGGNPRVGVCIEKFIPTDQVFAVAESVKRVFDQHGDRSNKHRARLRHVLERIGTDEFIRLYQQERARLAQEGPVGQVPEIRNLASRFLASEEPPKEKESAPTHVRVKPDKQAGRATIRLLLEFGDIPAEDLVRTGEIASRFGLGLVRTTQLQDLLIPGIPNARIDEALAALAKLQVDGVENHRVKMVTCTGAATCKLGICLSRNLATAIAQRLNRKGTALGEDMPVLRISGCPNSCGNHLIAGLGLEGKVRRHQGRLMPCYTVLAGGQIKEGASQLAQRLGTVPAKRIPDLLAQALAREPYDNPALKSLVESFAVLPEKVPEDYFSDFGCTEPFSLAGRGPGECGAGVLDVVRLDIEEARDSLKTARSHGDAKPASEALYHALVTAARALLVVFGLEYKKEREIFDAFYKNLIQPGWIRADTTDLLGAAMDWRLGDRDTLVDQAGSIDRLVQRVEELFRSLDANLKFKAEPAEKREAPKEDAAPKDSLVDLRGVACPLNFVKAKVALANIPVGQTLAILLDKGEPANNVPASFADQGQEVLGVQPEGDHFRVSIRRKK